MPKKLPLKIELMVLFAILLSGCQIFVTTPPQPIQNTTEPTVVNVTEVSNATEVVVVKPMFDYNIPRYGNVTFYVPNIKGEILVIVGTENETVLVDTGHSEDFKVVAKQLRNFGIEKINALVLTRNAETTSGNLQPLNTLFTIEKIYHNGLASYQQPLLSIKDLVPNEPVAVDKAIKVGRLQVEFAVPYDDEKGFSEVEEENSVVVKVSYGTTSVLYASGCGLNCEGRVANSNLKADILVAAQKGSCDATTTFFINKVQPSAVVAQGALCEEVAKRLESLGIQTLSTGKDGSLAFTTDGQNDFIVGGEG